jgi:hypothetical protein
MQRSGETPEREPATPAPRETVPTWTLRHAPAWTSLAIRKRATGFELVRERAGQPCKAAVRLRAVFFAVLTFLQAGSWPYRVSLDVNLVLGACALLPYAIRPRSERMEDEASFGWTDQDDVLAVVHGDLGDASRLVSLGASINKAQGLVTFSSGAT